MKEANDLPSKAVCLSPRIAFRGSSRRPFLQPGRMRGEKKGRLLRVPLLSMVLRFAVRPLSKAKGQRSWLRSGTCEGRVTLGGKTANGFPVCPGDGKIGLSRADSNRRFKDEPQRSPRPRRKKSISNPGVRRQKPEWMQNFLLPFS